MNRSDMRTKRERGENYSRKRRSRLERAASRWGPGPGGEGGETAAAGLAAKISSCLGRAGRFGYQAQALSSDLDIGPVGPLGLPGPRHVWALDVLGFFMMYGRPALETDRAKFAANSRAILFF